MFQYITGLLLTTVFVTGNELLSYPATLNLCVCLHKGIQMVLFSKKIVAEL